MTYNQAMHPNLQRLCVLGILIGSGGIGLSACDNAPKYSYIEGETMGTSYHIRYKQPEHIDKEAVKQAVDSRLIAINNSMSTYQKDSTISKFNQLFANEFIVIDSDFIKVLAEAKTVYKLSHGAFDPTVMPLIELWGFGSKITVDRLQAPPTAQEIARAKELVDLDAIELHEDKLSKTKSGVAIDFSAIAKGYAVDVIADVLSSNYQINNYMVEIGGEVATAGLNANRRPWQIAIDAPVINSSVSQRQMIAAIRQPTVPNQLHLATSGNYRNSIIFDGVRYSHTIDPSTGSPIVGGAASVTVAATSVSLADAWATALTAMPYDKAFNLAEAEDLAVLFIIAKTAEPKDTQAELEKWQIVETAKMQALRSDKL